MSEPTHYCAPCDKAVTPAQKWPEPKRCPECGSGRVKPVTLPRVDQ